MILHRDRYTTTNVPVRKLGVVVHDAESGDQAFDALVSLLGRPGDRVIAGSSPPRKYGSGYHAVTNGRGGYTTVATADVGPFAAPPLNQTWLHVCMPGRASQTVDEWHDPVSRQHILGVAWFIVDAHLEHGFPLVKLNWHELLAGDRGYCSHGDVSLAWRKTNHTDPGPNFPWSTLANDIATIMKGLAGPPAVPVADDNEEDDMQRFMIVANSDFPGPERYAYNGMHLRHVEDEVDYWELVNEFGLVDSQAAEPASVLRNPVMKTGTWIARRLAQ